MTDNDNLDWNIAVGTEEDRILKYLGDRKEIKKNMTGWGNGWRRQGKVRIHSQIPALSKQ